MKRFFSKPDYQINPDGVNTIEELLIGSIKQSILLQGQKVDNPVLLFLHGGPSMPLPGVSSRGRDYTLATNTKNLVKHFILVFWDQRGTGRSYHPNIPKDTMNVKQFVADTIELTNYLCNKFNQGRIHLAAHSWGTIPGLMAVHKRPDLYYTYTGLSQIVNWAENDRISYPWVLKEANKRKNRKALEELSSVGAPPYTESVMQWQVLRKWQQRFGTLIYSDHEIKHPGMRKLAGDMLFSADYSFKDVYNSFYKGFKLIYTDEFIKDIAAIDFIKSTTAFKLPITFIHGQKDVHVHGRLVNDYYEILKKNNNDVKLFWMAKSGHVYHPDDAKIIEEIMIGLKT